MSNPRSVMTEFRFLDQKRQAEGLTAQESARYAQLRELVGPEAAGPARSGFDVNAAAARLRESLLPAGLRNRPPEPAPAPAAEPEPTPEMAAAEQAWAEAPFADLAPEPAEPLFDPGSLAQEVRPQAWNPEAPGYDPNAPYDEAAWIAAGYDPTATYDWSAYGSGPDGQPLAADGAPATAEAAPAEAPPAWEGAAPDAAFSEPAPDLGAEPAPEAAAWSDGLAAAPEGEPVDAGGQVALDAPAELEAPAAPPTGPGWEDAPVEVAPEAWGATDAAPAEAELAAAAEQAWEAAAEPPPEPVLEAGVEQDWGAPAPAPAAPEVIGLEDLEAAPTAAEEALPFDPNAPFDHAKWFGRPVTEAAAPEAVEPDVTFDLAPEAPPDAPPSFGEYDEAAAALAAPGALDGGDPAAAPAAPEPAADLAADLFGDAAPATHLPAPEGAPFGAYDDAAASPAGASAPDAGLEAMLPFDPAAAAAIEPGAMPEGYDAGGPALDASALPPIEAGADADQMYGGPEGDALPGGAPLELGAEVPDWQPEAALEQGFELASDGSFGQEGAPPYVPTPAWGTPAAAPPAEGWESPPALDLAAPFDAGEAAPEAPAEELPTIDGAELLEELPAAAAPEPADLGAEGTPADLDAGAAPFALDGAFEEAASVEAAGYPPPDAEPFEAAAAPAPAAFEAAELFAAEASTPEPAAPPAPEPFAPEPAPAAEPEPALSYEAAAAEVPPEIAAAYAAAPAADTFELPPAVASDLFEAAPALEPVEAEPLEPEPVPGLAAPVTVAGSHRVVLHTVDGQVKRGLLVDAVLDAATLPLQPPGPGGTEEVPTEGVKAIFFMLAPGEKAPPAEGKKVRVTFRDGRQVAGFSPDYQDGLVGFFMIPADTRTNTGRIWVYQAAVKSVAVS